MISRRHFLAATPAAFAAAAATTSPGLAEEPGATPKPTPTPTPKPKPAPAASPARAESGPPVIGRSTRLRDLATAPAAGVVTASATRARILQVTDLHLFRTTAEDDKQTFLDLARLLELERPDLLTLTGDLWHDNVNETAHRAVDRLTAALGRWGVPWCMIWGNHDLHDDPQAAHDAFEQCPHSVYRGGGSHGDYRVEVRPTGAAPEAPPALDLVFLNSNQEGVGPWQLQALRTLLGGGGGAAPKPSPALVFFHIPLVDYQSRITGASLRGLKLEDVLSGSEGGHTLPVLQAANRVRACFCGHNHTNDYTVRTGEIDLVYGRSTGHAGYGGDRVRKGAKRIEVEFATGKTTTTTVFADGTHLA